MDRISLLPDELLRIIVSHLTFKEAIASSILSRQWRYLWADFGRLVFDGTKLEGEERVNYVKWVNYVIASREDSDVDEFRVSLYLSKAEEEGVMHEWVRYALERKAHTLELNLSSEGRGRLSRKESCSFPYTILQQHWIHFKQLRRISLEAVNVSGEALEFFLSNCPLLEGLSVSQSTELVTLRVIGPLPSLKLLEIRCCMSIKSVEIRDVASLVCFKYYGPGGKDVKIAVENAPMLVELHVGAWVRSLQRFLKQFGGIFERIEILNIEMRCAEDRWGGTLKLWNLKQLVVTYITSLPSRIRCMIPFANIVQASPRLEKYVLKLKAAMSGSCSERRIEEAKVMSDVYSNLKEIEYVGYGGVACEVKFIEHFVRRAPKLQKIAIHSRKLNPNLIPNKAIQARARAHQQLAALVPQSIVLDIF